MFRREPPPKESDNKFLAAIQKHEREWGTETYPEKPSLEDFLSATVVAFWKKATGKDKRHYATIHANTGEIEAHLAKMVLRSSLQAPERTLSAVFENQKKLRIKAFRIIFTPEE